MGPGELDGEKLSPLPGNSQFQITALQRIEHSSGGGCFRVNTVHDRVIAEPRQRTQEWIIAARKCFFSAIFLVQLPHAISRGIGMEEEGEVP